MEIVSQPIVFCFHLQSENSTYECLMVAANSTELTSQQSAVCNRVVRKNYAGTKMPPPPQKKKNGGLWGVGVEYSSAYLTNGVKTARVTHQPADISMCQECLDIFGQCWTLQA